ncbi:MAG: 2-hydroxy-acid oxidase, partial [Defluviitaleaceae bacterium]|nr:2-hydroxy-acid oxidase [Defluviitaleaceae bacterium]
KIKDIWAARSAFLESISTSYRLLDENDIVVPVNEIANLAKFLGEMDKKYDVKVMYFGHAGDGNLHIYTLSNDMEEEEFKRQTHEFMLEVYKKTFEIGGQLTGEHGIGFGKTQYYESAIGSRNLQLQQEIKKVFDPRMILNPGKVCFRAEEITAK